MSDDVALDCGDNSCVFAVRKGGMRTNGGCRCLRNMVPSAKSSELTALERSLRKTIAAHFLTGRESR